MPGIASKFVRVGALVFALLGAGAAQTTIKLSQIQNGSNIVQQNINNTFAPQTVQTFTGDPNNSNLAAQIIGLQGGIAPSATPGSVYGLNTALSAGLPRLGWWDGQLASAFITNGDTGCDLLNQCTGDPMTPLATQKSPQFVTPNIDNATAISLSVPDNPTGNFVDLQQGKTTPFCQYIPNAGHLFLCYGTDNRWTMSNNGAPLTDIVGASDPFSTAVLDQTGVSTVNSGSPQVVFAVTQAGLYRIEYYADQAAGCASVGSGALTVQAGWTDATHARVAATLTLTPGTVATGTSSFVGQGSTFWAAAASNITITDTYTGCSSGTWTYDQHVSVKRQNGGITQ